MEVGVIIGRFQVPELHEGHRWLIDTALRNHRKVVVFPGISARLFSKNNPLDYQTRERMIRAAYGDAVSIMPLWDKSSNEEWSKCLDESIEGITNKTGHAVLYGGRGSFIPSYKGKFKTVEVDSGMEGKSGTTLRTEIGRVVRSTDDFRAGQIYFSQNAPVRPIMGVDIALITRSGRGDGIEAYELAVGRKSWDAPFKWRLPGGKIEPNDVSLEFAARRELHEETGIDFKGKFVYLASDKISDWRDHGQPDISYFGALFLAEIDPETATEKYPLVANDDLIEVKWVPLSTAHTIGVPKHEEMITAVQAHIRWRTFNQKATK